MQLPLSIAIDIGGTKTKYGFITEEGKIIHRHETQTGNAPEPSELVNRLSKEILEASSKLKESHSLVGAGICAPNVNYYKGTVEHPPNLNWKGVIPLAKLFEESLSVPVALMNDANAAAVGEMYFGSAKGMKDFLFITLGTGLGSGIISNGQLIIGKHGFGGELGHTIIIQHGRMCGCGRKGCLEQYCSATGIVKTYFDILKNDGRPMPSDISIDDVDSEYIYKKALGGDEAAFYAFNYTGELLGFALANTVTCLDPEAIFLFGGLARAEELLFNPVRISFEKNLMNVFKNKISILPSGLHENDASLLGSASVIWDKTRRKNK